MAPARVMIVDNNPLALTSLRSLLKRMAELPIVATARNGVEALPLIQEIKPQVLIVDIQVLQTNGGELLGELHRSNIPMQVIVLTASLEEIAKQQTFDNDIIAYVSKDNAALLLDTLQRVVNNHN